MTVVHALGRVPRDVRQRFLRAAVQREARIGRERPGLALDPQRDVEIHVGLVALDQRRKLRPRVGSASPRSAPTAWRALARPALTSSLARSIASLRPRRGVLAVGELARPLQLDRGARQRVREHVVQLARDPAALGDRRRARLLIARVLKLGEQQLGPVLALARPLEELRDDPQQHRHQHLGRDSRRGAPGDRRDDAERDRHRAAERDAGLERQPSDRHEHRDPGRDAGGALELKPGDRDTGGAHHRDHGRPGARALRSGKPSRIAISSVAANTHSASVTASALPCSPGTGWLLALPSTTTRITAQPSGRSDRRWRCRRS